MNKSNWYGPTSVVAAAFTFTLSVALTITRLGVAGFVPVLVGLLVAAALMYTPGRSRHIGTGLLTGLAALPVGFIAYVIVAAVTV